MATFNNVEQLQKYIKEMTKQALQTQVANKVKELIEKYIQIEIYDSYSPSVYQRTYQLLKSVRVGKVQEVKSNVFEVEIYITEDLMGHKSEFGGSSHDYAPQENVRATDVFEWLEHGYYQFWGRPKTYIMEETMKELKRDGTIIKEFTKYLEKHDLKVV